MDREQLISRLPDTLAVAVRLRDAGQQDDLIAVALGVPIQSVPVLLSVATGKLGRLAQGVEPN